MPIKFRCSHCQQFLGISRSKAGALTDCPMCGRTVRVPDLDGKVAPLPSPELNHGDRGLAQALDALAALESGPVVLAEQERAPQKVKLVPVSAAPAIEAVPIPTPDVQDVTAPLMAPGSVDPLRDLAAIRPGRESEVTPLAKPPWNKREVAFGVGGLVLGLLVGRISAPAAAPVGHEPQPPVVVAGPKPVEGAPLAPAPANSHRAIEGRVTYITATDETRADAGARVLALPIKHPAASRIAARSFQAGALAEDLKLAQAAIRALGGDFVSTDAEGRYEIHLQTPGKYRLLIISRYQSRSDSDLNPDLEAVLKVWFDQPQSLVGQMQSFNSEFQFDGEKCGLRDHLFPKTDSL